VVCAFVHCLVVSILTSKLNCVRLSLLADMFIKH
jgi:hypothetical protein